jgi:hypothetical protein
MKKRNFFGGLAALLVPIAPQTALAQNAGTIRGIVTDPSNSLVPGATVVATGAATGALSRTATTDGQGRYTLPNMPPGNTVSVRTRADS